MSSLQPSPDNDYAIPPGWTLTRANLAAVFASLHARILAREALEATFQGLINDGTGQALAVIQANVAPQLTALQQQIAAFSTEIDQLEDAVAGLLGGTLSIAQVVGLAAALDAKAPASALAAYAPLASPALTGTPTAPTAAAGDNSTRLATTAFVRAAVSALAAAAPSTLDTLNELAAALGNDANFAANVTTLIGTKEPAIPAGTSAQFWRGDKTWAPLTDIAPGSAYASTSAPIVCAAMTNGATDPTATQGTEIAALTYAARSATSRIRLSATVSSQQSTVSGNWGAIIALFRGTTLLAAWNVPGGDPTNRVKATMNSVSLDVPAASVAEETYSLRMGHVAGHNVCTVNPAGGLPSQVSSLALIEL